MNYLIFSILFFVEIFALFNRGGGPLLSHLVLTIATCAALIFYMIAYRDRPLTFRWPHIFYLVFVLFFVLSLITSLTPSYGLSELLLFANTAILFLLISNLEISEKELRFFAIILLAIAVADTLAGYFIYTQTPFPRFAGTFLDLQEPYTSFSNDFGNFLLLITPVSLWMYFKKHERATTTVLLALANGILLSGFLLTFSRGAWISAAGMLMVALTWFIFNTRRLNAWRSHILRIITLIIITVILVNGLQASRADKFETTTLVKKLSFQADEGAASASDRLEFWRGALELIAERPWLGSGVFSFKHLNPHHQRIFEVNWDHPHNIFLKIGVENGILAVAAYVAFLISTAVLIIRFFYKRPIHEAAPFLLGTLGALAHNLIDFNFIVGNYMFFVVFVAIGLSYVQQKSHSSHRYLQNSLTTLLALSILLVGLGVYEGFYNYYFKKGRTAIEEKTTTAVAMLETASALIFERDRVNYLADAYDYVYRQTGDKNLRQKQKSLLIDATKTGSVDASLYDRLGYIYFEEKIFAAAEEAFSKTLSLNPHNHFRYYYRVFEVQQKQGKKFNEELKAKVLMLLSSYKPMLIENKHFTVATDNPEYASKLYGLFDMKSDKEEIEFFWLRESLKFMQKYGPLPLRS